MQLSLATQGATWINNWFIIYVYGIDSWHPTSGNIQLEKMGQNLSLNLVINGSLALEGMRVNVNSLGKVVMGDKLALDFCGPQQSVQSLIHPAMPRWMSEPMEKVNREM